ncbi:MAG: NAD(P)-dependent oxidoreductase, partial [Desulfobacteraceae bacterium]
VGTASYGIIDKAPLKFLKKNGALVHKNPFGRRPTERELIDFLQGMDGLIAGLEPLTERVLVSSAKTLKAISRVGIGLDSIDLKVAKKLGIQISNTPDAPSFAVAENTLAALLCIYRKIAHVNDAMHCRKWEKKIGKSLQGSTIALIGYGRIGKIVSRLLQPFGCRILIIDPLIKKEDLQFRNEAITDLETAISQSDVISFHCSGKKMILDKKKINLLKPGVTILNSARAELIDESLLIEGIKSGIIWHAWIDVFETEPYKGPLCDLPKIILSPHNATFTKQCRQDMEMQAAVNLINDLNGVI